MGDRDIRDGNVAAYGDERDGYDKRERGDGRRRHVVASGQELLADRTMSWIVGRNGPPVFTSMCCGCPCLCIRRRISRSADPRVRWGLMMDVGLRDIGLEGEDSQNRQREERLIRNTLRPAHARRTRSGLVYAYLQRG